MNTVINRLWILLLLAFLVGPQAVVAATISPNQPGAGTYNPTAGPVACNGGTGTCTTKLEPASVINLGVPNATTNAGLEQAFTAQFPGFTYAYGGSLNVTYNITKYSAFNTGLVGGATFVMDITDPNHVLPANLHWVQWVNDNFNFTGFDGANLTAPTGLGNHENTIDGAYKTGTFAGSPFYDVFAPGDPNAFNTTPPHFEDSPKRSEPTAANPVITWNAELFLVSALATQGDVNNKVQVTFYDGVEWGWQTTFTPTPLPAAWTMMLIGLGMARLLLRRRTAARPV